MPNWPITTTSITEGTIIKASDLENNFQKLKNAANTLHERFSTLSFSCPIDVHFPQFTAGSTTNFYRGLCLREYNPGDNVAHDQTSTDYTVFGVFQVPSWCQAVRVRTFDVLNSSIIPYDEDSSVTATVDGTTPPEIGARYIAALSGFDQNNTDGSVDGTAITSVTWTSLADAEGYSASYTGAPQIKQTTPNTLVLGGNYIVVYGRGRLNYAMESGDILGPTHYRFHVNMMCDAMVPIP
jgi:hypothetical protein